MKRKILIVDDEKITLQIFKMILNNLGYTEIFLATGGKAGLEILRKNNIDLVFLDLMMPDISGLEVLKIMKAHKGFKNIPVILHTGAKNTKDIENARKLGVFAVLPKPCDVKELEKSLEEVFKLTA